MNVIKPRSKFCLLPRDMETRHRDLAGPYTKPSSATENTAKSTVRLNRTKMKTTPHQPRKIAIVGASGNLGKQTVNFLLAKGIHTITAISRLESSATFPDGVVVKRGDYSDAEFRKEALQGQDVLVLQVEMMSMDVQEIFIRTAAEVGVPWILPTEFGSDTTSKLVQELHLMKLKVNIRSLIEELGVSSWIAVVTNPWFDFSMKLGMWGIDIKNRTAKFWGDGWPRIPTTTLRRAGEATALLLSLPGEELENLRNRHFYVHSFMGSQKYFLESVMRVTDTTEKDWKIQEVDVEEAYEKAKNRAAEGDIPSMVEMLYILHFMDGYGGDYSAKLITNEELGLENEDIDDAVRGVIQSMEE